MITFQEFEEKRKQGEAHAIQEVISDWKNGEIYRTAVIANTYDRQKNKTIETFIKKVFTLTGLEVEDFTASNNKIASNFFRRLNTQRNTYSLGNGVSFDGEGVKERFGGKFDTTLLQCGYDALIHGVCFPFWNGKLNKFSATEFAPLWDEETSVLMAGIRFWQIDASKPMFAVVYERDGFTKWKKADGDFTIAAPKQSYVTKVQNTAADGDEIVEQYNYSALPIIPLWGSSLHQSTLIGLRSQIDSYDMIRSGFANDLNDVAQIFWIIENFGGMNNDDLAKFRDRLRLNHIAEADTSDGGKITPYTMQIPFEARQTYLDGIRKSIYEDYGALDVHQVSADSTNDHLEAAYQPLDENADDFEARIIEFVQSLGQLIGLSEEAATPVFKRNRISNHREMVEMLTMAAEWLDEETIISKLPFVTVDEVKGILDRRSDDAVKSTFGTPTEEEEEV